MRGLPEHVDGRGGSKADAAAHPPTPPQLTQGEGMCPKDQSLGTVPHLECVGRAGSDWACSLGLALLCVLPWLLPGVLTPLLGCQPQLSSPRTDVWGRGAVLGELVPGEPGEGPTWQSVPSSSATLESGVAGDGTWWLG